MEMIYLYADGAVRNNQSKNNVGAWACILEYKGKTKEFSDIIENTTNNICELTAVISGLSKIKDKTIPVAVYSDSQYVISGVNQWSKNWIKNGWQTSEKKPVENIGLWRWLLDLVGQFETVSFNKCKGHSNDIMNNKVDALCNLTIDAFLDYN